MRTTNGPHSGSNDDTDPNTPDSEWTEKGETFRVIDGDLFLRLIFAAYFLLILIVDVCFMFAEEPCPVDWRERIPMFWTGLLGAVVFGPISAVLIYFCVSYFKERTIIHGSGIWIRTMLQNQKFGLPELQQLAWRVSKFNGGGLVFQLPEKKLHLNLGCFSDQDQLRIITLLRDRVPESIQKDWPIFCRRVALPLRQGLPQFLRSHPTAVPVTITRNRYDRIALVAIPLSIIYSLVTWSLLKDPQILISPFFVIGGWLALRFSMPAEGCVIYHVPKTRTSSDPAMLASYAFFLGGLFLLPLLEGFKINDLAIMAIGFSVMLPGIIILIIQMPKQRIKLQEEKEKRKPIEEQADQEAAEIWEQGADALNHPEHILNP